MNEPMESDFGHGIISGPRSSIGQTNNEALIASAQVTLAQGVSLRSTKDDIRGFTARLARGEYPVC